MIGILGQVEEVGGRRHIEHMGAYFRVSHGSLHTLSPPTHPTAFLLQPSQLAGLAKGITLVALFSMVAALNLGLSG